MIKYLGSKRALVPTLTKIAQAAETQTAIDLFCGTTRVAQGFKTVGINTIACDLASYAYELAGCYIATDADLVDVDRIKNELDKMQHLKPDPGYFTETFCEKARYFQPQNGALIDACRNYLVKLEDDPIFPILFTALMEAADRVDSTTGVQMAYLKKWASRSYNPLELRLPKLLSGPGRACQGDATKLVEQLPEVDLVYLDPPYNQHRYFTNYHIWETLRRWDAPETYGVACKRVDARGDAHRSVFNSKKSMAAEFFELLKRLPSKLAVVSYNNESWIDKDQMTEALSAAGFEKIDLYEFDQKRYIGSQIGIFDPSGKRVGKPGKARNIEYVFVAGPAKQVSQIENALNTG